MKHELDSAESVSIHEQRALPTSVGSAFFSKESWTEEDCLKLYLGIWGLNWSLGHETSDQQVYMFPSTEKSV